MADRLLLRRPRRLLAKVRGGVAVFLSEVLVVLVIGAIALATAAVVSWIF